MTQQTAATAAPHDDQPEVRWLSAEQQAQWRAFRDGNALLNDALARQLDADSGLSLGEYEVLVRLSEAPGRTLRMSEIADGLAHSRSRLTHTIRRMEAAGLVERTACREDARGVNATMTEAGWERLVAAAPGHVRAVREHLVDVLTPGQLEALGAAMQAVTDALRGGSNA
ncbi:MarR family winged helix-turn-helix transcriptional regulator [Cellulomonas chengniuliangii]|uniref:MarR family transcriptional regulator n=1 Tax=Cellulomonas chengniuliangii TaxID=2968084 RepID=A0ABY5KYX2_9CELL|nr:MarR family transcriptional regulator [Cellulomonas chengniuliangii]MCC2309534.1 MarR family transcriptional regulator [Cellulomonas chengniuliangii]MCC2316805.1 MarR family transcriptional regulator [Cellulomonas chengniuliangii]UUI74910.1 MarR family transcriptional regulator [Cellulomonas chengniuliangii]